MTGIMSHAGTKPSRGGRAAGGAAYWACVLGVLLLCGAGCQARRSDWRLLNFGRVDRVPPPATGSLNVPQFGGVNMGGAAAPILYPPPSQLPVQQTPVVNPGGGLSPGVFFPTNSLSPGASPGPATGGSSQPGVGGPSPWHTTGGGAAGPTFSQIPDRGAPTNFVAGATAPTGFDPRLAPSLLPGGFDPYDTSTIPLWSAQGSPQGANFNPLVTTSNPTLPPGAQEGFWPGQLQGVNTPTTFGASATGSGSGERRRRWFGGQRFQPANVTGQMTTASIDNPMIPVTQTASAPAAAAYYPVQPAAVGNASVPGGGLSYGRWLQVQQAAQQQARQQAMYQSQWLQQQQQAQAAALRSGPGSSAYQVLAENSTAVVAENQIRLGAAGSASAVGNDPNRGGVRSAGGPLLAPTQLSPGQAPPMFQTTGQPLDPSGQNGLRSGWQNSGVR